MITPSSSELENWAIVSYNDDTGLGRMAQDARAVLGIGRQLVIPSQRLANRLLGPGDFLLEDDTAEASLREFLSECDGLLVLEKADWSPVLLPLAKSLGCRVAAVPMWEWFRASDPLWRWCDLFICPNQKCLEVVRGAGFKNAVALPWALDLARLPSRRISGPARAFLHNGGLIDHDDRKSTREVIAAFERLADPRCRLLLRLQKPADLPPLPERLELRIGNLPEPRDLWQDGDVAVQPSKMEGIGFTILEPICSGIPVITLDAAPMNEYAAELLVTPRWGRRKAFASQWVSQAHLRLPPVKALTRLMRRCAETDLTGISSRQRAWAEEIFSPETLRARWTRALQSAPSKVALAAA